MTGYRHSYCTRSVSGVFVAILFGVFLGIAFAIISDPHAKLFGVLFGLLSAWAFISSTVRLIFPLTWSSELAGNVLRWVSPKRPRESREIRATEITEARNTGGEIDTLELTLVSGECIHLPPNCVGDPRALLSALKQANPAIRLVYDGKPAAGFVPSRWTGFKVVRSGVAR